VYVQGEVVNKTKSVYKLLGKME